VRADVTAQRTFTVATLALTLSFVLAACSAENDRLKAIIVQAWCNDHDTPATNNAKLEIRREDWRNNVSVAGIVSEALAAYEARKASTAGVTSR
jgi:hypothetical protein